MSITAHQWVVTVLDDPACRLCRTDRHLLRELADWADSDGVCWPATDTIARRLGVHYDTVGRARRRLVDAGYVAYSPGGGADSGLYRLLIPGRLSSTPSAPARRVKRRDPPRERGRPSAPARSTLRVGADRTSNEPLYEPRAEVLPWDARGQTFDAWRRSLE